MEEDNKRILFVDDNPIVLRSMSMMLKGLYSVDIANSVKQAFAVMEKRLPDLIFLDYEMPECDGMKAFQLLKADDRYKNIPVIFMTGVTAEDQIASILELKPAGFIIKPPEQDKIVEIIAATL